MEAKEKARNLVNKYATITGKHHRNIIEKAKPDEGVKHAKQCALICINELIEDIELFGKDTNETFHTGQYVDYWQKVKKEIEKL